MRRSQTAATAHGCPLEHLRPTCLNACLLQFSVDLCYVVFIQGFHRAEDLDFMRPFSSEGAIMMDLGDIGPRISKKGGKLCQCPRFVFELQAELVKPSIGNEPFFNDTTVSKRVDVAPRERDYDLFAFEFGELSS